MLKLFIIVFIIIFIIVLIIVFKFYKNKFRFYIQPKNLPTYLFQTYNDEISFMNSQKSSQNLFLSENPPSSQNLSQNPEQPLYLFQTYKTKSKIPSFIYENIHKFAPEYTHMVYDDNDCVKFLTQYFDKSVVTKFHSLELGAHKADLVRYCLLYIYGGVYMDIKTELIRPIENIFKYQNMIYTVISFLKEPSIYQGVLAGPRNHPLFFELINFIVQSDQSFLINNYLGFCKDIFQRLELLTGMPLHIGLNKNNVYLLEEQCNSNSNACHDKLDRYGLCCNIFDNNTRVFKTRYASYPW